MKLLITADLHFRLHWFRWLIDQAPDFDLICIAGDLLDMFKSETPMEQAREVRTLIRELADIVPVAVCSGNHDKAGRLASRNRQTLRRRRCQSRFQRSGQTKTAKSDKAGNVGNTNMLNWIAFDYTNRRCCRGHRTELESRLL
jgi:predicted MPP superfamily phosphohydrolase